MDFQTWPPELLVVDVEGNGATPPDLVEIAVVPIIGGAISHAAARSWLIRPARPISGRASGIHGITNADVATASSWTETAPDVRAALAGAWIAAHNAAAVEYRVLRAHLPGWEPAGVIDTLRLGRAACPDAARHSLDALIQHTRVDTSGLPGQRHRALYDATATALLLLSLSSHFGDFAEMAVTGVPPGLPGGPVSGESRQAETPTLW